MHMLFHYAEAGGSDINDAMKSGASLRCRQRATRAECDDVRHATRVGLLETMCRHCVFWRTGTGPLANMILAVHQSGVGVHRNRLVMLAYLDLSVRYASVLHYHPELLLPVLQAMMGAGCVLPLARELGVSIVSLTVRLVRLLCAVA